MNTCLPINEVQSLVVEACKLGARGYQVLGWVTPESASTTGRLIIITPEAPKSASESLWYER